MTIPEPEPKNAKNKTDPPQGPTRRSTRLGTSAPAASRGVNGKGEASPPAEKPKAPRANQRATRNEGGEFLPEEEQDELLLRAEHGSNGATPLDRNAQGATQRAANPTTCCFCSVPSSVTKALVQDFCVEGEGFRSVVVTYIHISIYTT